MLPIECKTLFTPELSEVCDVLQNGLQQNFENVNVTVTPCPDLTQPPFNLAGPGLCGSPRIADVGGIPNLIPIVDKSKIYNVSELAALSGLKDAFVIGAGAGPFDHLGFNSEMMTNLIAGDTGKNKSRICSMIQENYKLQELPDDQKKCGLMMNIYACEGKPGKVIKVTAQKRTGKENFISCLRKSLEEKYKKQPVGVGGIFRLVSGEVKCHVMPSFSTEPLMTDEEVNNWMKFFNFPAPMTFFSVFVSHDPGLDLRLEHSHGYGENYGGHYHYDVTPDTVQYEGYFHVADSIYRIDRPDSTHNIGKN